MKNWKKVMAVLVCLLLLLQTGFTSVFATSGDLYSKIQDLTDPERAAAVGVVWEYISEYEDGTNMDALVDDIWDEFKAIGMDQVLDDKGITVTDIKDTISSFKTNENAIKAIVNLSTITNSTHLQDVLDSLQAGGYIDGDMNTLAGNNLAQMLMAADAINKPVFTNDSSGNVIVKTSNMDLLTTLANILVDSDHTQNYSALASTVADEINSLSSSQKAAVISVLTSFNLYTTTTYGGGGGGGALPPAATATPTPATATPIPSPVVTGVSDAKNYLDDAASSLEKLTDVPQVVEQAKTVIKNVAETIKSSVNSGTSTQEVDKALQGVVNTVMKKVNTQSVTPTVSAGAAKAVLDQSTVTGLLNKIDTIVKTAKDLKAAAEENKVDVKVEKILNIVVAPPSTEVSQAEVDLPSTLLAKAAEQGIDKVTIDSGVAVISIAPDALKVVGDKEISLSAAVVEKSTLPEDVVAAVGESAVYDFNMLVGDTKVSKFEKPVEISVPYTLKQGEDPKKITVFYINDKGQLENVIGKYDEATGKVQFKTKHFSGYFAKVNNVTFSDVAAITWAKGSVEAMAAKGVIAGMGEGKFLPMANVTRAQFAALIVRAFSLQDDTATSAFTDVKSGEWFYKDVAAAVKAGVISGRPDGSFAPDENITRQDMAVILERVLKNVSGKASAADTFANKFVDKQEIASYAKDSVSMAVQYGILQGMPGDKFDPKAYATRAQAAVVIDKLFNID